MSEKRSYIPEIMDDFSIQDERIDRALVELKYINKFLGGNSVTKKGLKFFYRRFNLNEKIIILDAGGGASDILLSNKKFNYDIYNLDINYKTCLFVKKHSPEVNIINANAEAIPVKSGFVDIVHLSLFIHHFNEDELVKLLRDFLQTSKLGIIINDLRRSAAAYAGIKILTILFSKSRMVKNDGPLSVKRSFLKNELESILGAADITNYIIKRRWAFRWLIIILKDDNKIEL